MTADDLRRIRFPLAFRGYRMAEVDALLERLAEEREAADRRDVRRPACRVHAGPKVTATRPTSAH